MEEDKGHDLKFQDEAAASSTIVHSDDPAPYEYLSNGSTPGSSFMKRLSIAGINILMVLVLAALALVAWIRLPAFIQNLNRQEAAQAESADLPTQPPDNPPDDENFSPSMLNSVSFPVEISSQQTGILRKPLLYTDIPSRPRVDVITYTVQTGDSLFSIADKFGVKPETILWGNFDTLEDNPHLLSTDQVLNILPTNGTYYQWNAGDNLAAVASFFQVDESAIISYPGNNIDLTTAENSDPGIEPGTWVIIPDGKRPLKDWGPPAISRSNPASARYYGDGYCGSVYEGAIGSGTFIWPTTARSISGYGYSGIHPAIDIAGAVGNATFASDSGVVVFAGWSNYGYGYMVVIDHGNGWQTAYAHLSAVGVTCGQSVFQGGYIGAVGSTGNSTGAHLHFELVYNGAKPNPLDYLQ